jgi:integrase
MDPMGKLTKAEIAAATAEGRDLFVWDTTLPGFGLRVKPSGIKTLIVQYRTRYGKSKRLTLGRYGTLTLDEGRQEARRQLSWAARGGDPRQERLDDRAEPTVAQLAERYMTDHCEGRCKASTMAAHRWLLQKFILPALGRFAIREVKPADINRLHQELKSTPYNANRAVGLVRAMYGKAEKTWGVIARGQNPASGIEPFSERKRSRFLTLEELQQLMQTLDEMEREGDVSPTAAATYRLLVLTGARLNEIRTLRWTHIKWPEQMIVLDEHKADKKGPKAIPLNKPALRILESLPRSPDSPYVLTGATPGQPLVNIQKPWRRIRRRAGLDGLRIHDLRHSFASFAIAQGASLPVVGGLLGHRSLQATATYAHLSATPVRAMSEAVGELIAPTLLLESPRQERPLSDRKGGRP